MSNKKFLNDKNRNVFFEIKYFGSKINLKYKVNNYNFLNSYSAV